jgi:hypothetical protein
MSEIVDRLLVARDRIITLEDALRKAISNLEMASISVDAFGDEDDPEYIRTKEAWESDLAFFRAALKALPPQQDAAEVSSQEST